MVELLYPEEWKSFITNSSKCEGSNSNQYEDSITDITFPQPSLSEKITPRVIILVEQCCIDITSRAAEGFSANTRNMSLDEYIDQYLNETTGGNVFTINSGTITLDGNPAYKEVQGLKTLDP